MTIEILEIVNRARERAGLSRFTLSEFNLGTEREMLYARQGINRAYRDLIDLGLEDTRQTFQLNINSSSNEYDLPFTPDRLDNLHLRAISGSNEPHRLTYEPLHQVQCLYPRLDLIPQGEPHEFFIKDTSDNNVVINVMEFPTFRSPPGSWCVL